MYFQSNRQYNSFNSQYQREEEKGNMRVYRAPTFTCLWGPGIDAKE